MPIRVLLVDDSPLVRSLLRDVLMRFPDVEVVGEAGDGLRAEELVRDLRPDVVTMDVVMPMMGGLETIRRVMATHPTPIVVVADLAGEGRDLGAQALMAGAVEVFPKPRRGFGEIEGGRLLAALRRAARPAKRPALRLCSEPVLWAAARTPQCLGIVASSGGTQVLRALLGSLRATFPVPIAVVQHTTPGFVQALCEWLDLHTPLAVRVAKAGSYAEAGQVLLAPEDAHLKIGAEGRVSLDPGPPVGGHRPSGTVLLSGLARAFGPRAVGVVLTGLGEDGAAGLAELARAGGVALCEDPETAAVGGMPRAAIAQTPEIIVRPAERLAALLAALDGSPGS